MLRHILAEGLSLTCMLRFGFQNASCVRIMQTPVSSVMISSSDDVAPHFESQQWHKGEALMSNGDKSKKKKTHKEASK